MTELERLAEHPAICDVVQNIADIYFDDDSYTKDDIAAAVRIIAAAVAKVCGETLLAACENAKDMYRTLHVRRFDRANGKELTPVSVKEAALALARYCARNPTANDVEAFAADLLAGHRNQTSEIIYVPGAEAAKVSVESLAKGLRARLWGLNPDPDR